MSARHRLPALLLACALACESDPTAVPEGYPTPLVHAVLNPASSEEFILLENTLVGRVDLPHVDDPDPAEPIKDRGGDPILDAYVVVYNSHGDSAIALERRTDPGSAYRGGGGGKGAGVYVFTNAVWTSKALEPPPPPYFLRVTRGERYRLQVLSNGHYLTAATTVPDANASTAIVSRVFNRDRDTLTLELPPALFAKRYGIHIQTPKGPFELFTQDLQYRLLGTLRNVDNKHRPLAFMPGFEQVISLSAVDTNYFDFFRSANDTITGHGLIEHVTGGSGVFGSYAPLNRVLVRVTADMNDPVEARYVEDGTGKSLRLWVNEQSNGLMELSGNYGLLGGSTTGVLGQLQAGDISLVFLEGQSLTDTLYTARGTWRGDEITATTNTGANVVFRRAATP